MKQLEKQLAGPGSQKVQDVNEELLQLRDQLKNQKLDAENKLKSMQAAVDDMTLAVDSQAKEYEKQSLNLNN